MVFLIPKKSQGNLAEIASDSIRDPHRFLPCGKKKLVKDSFPVKVLATWISVNSILLKTSPLGGNDTPWFFKSKWPFHQSISFEHCKISKQKHMHHVSGRHVLWYRHT